MYAGRRRPETVSKKKSDFFLMGECFFLTYFLIGASGGLNPIADVPAQQNITWAAGKW